MSKEGALRWWAIARDAFRLWLDCNAFSHAAALAFYTLFSLAPVFIISVSVIGLVLGDEAAHGQIVAQLQDVMGREVALAVELTVARSRIEEAGLLPTVLGVLALLVGATTVFAQMQYSLNTIWGVAARPNVGSFFTFMRSRLLSLTVMLAIGLALLGSVLFGVVLRAVLRFAHRFAPEAATLMIGTELLASLLAVALGFCAIFKVLPDVMLKWRDVVIGALLTALLFSVGRYAIAVYLAYTATASAFGAAGSVVLILLWVYYSSLILLFGAAFTKTNLLARGGPVVPRDSAVLVRHEFLTGPSA